MPGGSYDASTKAKAIRLVREPAGDYPTQRAAISAVPGWLGMSARRCASGSARQRSMRARRRGQQ